jgi:membrane AbrB-like protein
MRLQLGIFTVALVALFFLVKLPAAVLLGAMGAAMIVSGRGAKLAMPARVFTLAQAVVGCMIARSLRSELFGSLGHHLALFVTVTLSVLVLATLLGLVLARLRVLPGTTALWGAFPGAASVMMLMSESYGADMRLVAFMQYLRVVMVAMVASLVGRLLGLSGAGHHAAWLAPIAWRPFFATLTLIGLGGFLGPRLRMASGPFLGTLIVATLLQDLAGLPIELPQPLLGLCYVILGWAIGLRFTRDTLGYVARALPRVLASIGALVALCAGLGFAVAKFAHLDLLTAYFATSPGGADSIAILAAGSTLDLPLVMSIQIGRALTILLLGPSVAKYATRFALPTPAAASPKASPITPAN